MAALAEMMADDIEWGIPAIPTTTRTPETFKGKEAVLGWFGGLASTHDTPRSSHESSSPRTTRSYPWCTPRQRLGAPAARLPILRHTGGRSGMEARPIQSYHDTAAEAAAHRADRATSVAWRASSRLTVRRRLSLHWERSQAPVQTPPRSATHQDRHEPRPTSPRNTIVPTWLIAPPPAPTRRRITQSSARSRSSRPSSCPSPPAGYNESATGGFRLSGGRGAQELDEPVGCPDVVEHDVVVRPHLSDEQEGDRVGEIGRARARPGVHQVRVIRG